MATSGEQKARNRELVERLVDDLAGLDDAEVRSKAMFGGHGIFADDVMFAMVTSDGRACLRVGDENLEDFTSRGAERFHERMPYHRVPDEVLDDGAELRRWAATALGVARAAR